MKEVLFKIGVITGPHGRFGKLKVYPLTDFPQRFHELKEIYLELKDERRLFQISGVRMHQNQILLDLDGIGSREEAEKYRGFYVKIPEEELVGLPPGHYYLHEIIGLTVITDTGEILGSIKDILRTGSNDVYVIAGEKELLIPATHEVVQEINLKGRFMEVKLLEGLL